MLANTSCVILELHYYYMQVLCIAISEWHGIKNDCNDARFQQGELHPKGPSSMIP